MMEHTCCPHVVARVNTLNCICACKLVDFGEVFKGAAPPTEGTEIAAYTGGESSVDLLRAAGWQTVKNLINRDDTKPAACRWTVNDSPTD